MDIDELLELERLGLEEGLHEGQQGSATAVSKRSLAPGSQPEGSAAKRSKPEATSGVTGLSQAAKKPADITDDELLELAASQPGSMHQSKAQEVEGLAHTGHRQQRQAAADITNDELLQLAASQADDQAQQAAAGASHDITDDELLELAASQGAGSPNKELPAAGMKLPHAVKHAAAPSAHPHDPPRVTVSLSRSTASKPALSLPPMPRQHQQPAASGSTGASAAQHPARGQHITDDELLALAASQADDSRITDMPTSDPPPARTSRPITLPPAPACASKTHAGSQARAPAAAASHAVITDDELLALAASQADDGFTDVLGSSMQQDNYAKSSAARPITLPPAPGHRRPATHAHAQPINTPENAEITDEELLALVASQAHDPLNDMPSSRMPAWQSPAFAKPAPPSQAPAQAARLYEPEPASRPQHDSAAEDFDMEQEPVREWTLPALNPLDIDGSAMSVVAGGRGGLKVYCRLKSKVEDEPDSVAELQRARGGLLAQPLSVLMQQLEDASFAAALAASERERDADAAAEERAASGAEASTSMPAQQQQQQSRLKKKKKKKPRMLWVNKYSPQGYADLLSDETINREVAKWLMCWRKCMNDSAEHYSARQQAGQRKPAAPPEHKLLLLSGPPGLGKTTLAHVLAGHCGFRAVEINASDERTAGSLAQRINDAVQMQAVLGDKRPNCVVIDEIDGATGGAEGRGAIHALLKIIQAAPRPAKPAHQAPGEAAASRDDDSDNDSPDRPVAAAATAAKKRGKAGAQPLNRPLIAICNDLYAPALRPLRNVARIMQFKSPQVDRLLSRLQLVCLKERLAADKQALAVLCEGTQQDIRACLNTLQFLARRCRHVRVADVEQAAIGQKDVTRSAFTLWQLLLSGRGAARGLLEMQRLYNIMLDFGDSDLLCNGLFEHAWDLRYMDVHLKSTALVADRLRDADCLAASSFRLTDFGLGKFAPALLLNIRRLVSGVDRVGLRWPRALGEAQRSRTANTAMLRSWLADACAHIVSTLSLPCAVQEVLPALTAVLAAPQRIVASNLLPPMEAAARAQLVETMLDYGVSFALSGADLAAGEGSGDVVLTPPLQRVTHFEGQPGSSRKLALPVRQLLAHEAHMQGIRRREQASQQEGTHGGTLRPEHGQQAAAMDSCEAPHAAAPMEHDDNASGPQLVLSVNQRAKGAGAAAAAQKPAKKLHWLGQLRQKHEQKLTAACKHTTGKRADTSGSENAQGPPVLYKFHEGYTNAVKRPVCMKDLL